MFSVAQGRKTELEQRKQGLLERRNSLMSLHRNVSDKKLGREDIKRAVKELEEKQEKEDENNLKEENKKEEAKETEETTKGAFNRSLSKAKLVRRQSLLGLERQLSGDNNDNDNNNDDNNDNNNNPM